MLEDTRQGGGALRALPVLLLLALVTLCPSKATAADGYRAAEEKDPYEGYSTFDAGKSRRLYYQDYGGYRGGYYEEAPAYGGSGEEEYESRPAPYGGLREDLREERGYREGSGGYGERYQDYPRRGRVYYAPSEPREHAPRIYGGGGGERREYRRSGDRRTYRKDGYRDGQWYERGEGGPPDEQGPGKSGLIRDESECPEGTVPVEYEAGGKAGYGTKEGRRVCVPQDGPSRAREKELGKTGLTDEAVRTLRDRPEFSGLSPDEVAGGRDELLRKKRARDGGRMPEGIGLKALYGEKEVPHLFERYRTEKPSQEVEERLKPFGYDLFFDSDLTPPGSLPAASDYVIGPGDEVNLLLWGRVNANYSLTVSRDGMVLIPEIGPLAVAGMTLKDMEALFRKKAREIVGAEITVTMGRLRSIQVFVLGEVKFPGSYTVSAMTTLTNALLYAGGPSGIGSLRRVEIRRGGKSAHTIDLYGLLLRGDRTDDRRLRDGDVVFVHVAGPLVGVTGEVRRPAVYELKAGEGGEAAEDLAGVIELAGGTLPTAYSQQVQVERVESSRRRVVLDVDASDLSSLESFALRDADMVKVFSMAGSDENAVHLLGNVRRPGKYELKDGMTIAEVLGGAEGLGEETFLDYGLVKRAATEDEGVRLIPFDLGSVLEGDEEVALEPGDSIYIFSRWFFEERPTVEIAGEVRRPGVYGLEEKMRVRDLVLMAGGLTKDASTGRYELYRTDGETNITTVMRYGLGSALSGSAPENAELEDGDRVVVHPVWEASPTRHVTVTGAVNRPGEYLYAENMTVADLVFAGGGLRESAFLHEAELASRVVEDGRVTRVEYRPVDLGRALSGEPEEDVAVSPYDTLHVKKIVGWDEERYVEIEGEVRFPGRYIVKKGERFSSLIERAGGFTENAYLKGAVFTRRSIKEMQQKMLDEAIDRAERLLLTSSAETIETALTPEAARQNEAATMQRRALIEKMRQAKARGRVSIRLEDFERFKGSPNDITLEDGDMIVVPQVPMQVQVVGAVFNPSAFVFEKGITVSGYLRKAGGLTRDADEEEIYVLKTDGTAVSRKESGGSWGLSWDDENRQWGSGGLMSSRLEPGDTLVVPEETERVAWLREAKDITQILYQIAVAAGVLIVAF